MRKYSSTGMAVVLAAVIGVVGLSGFSVADPGHGPGYGQGYGYGQRMGPGTMGPHGGGGMGHGGYGGHMMGPGGYGGQMMGPGGRGYGGHMMGPHGGGRGYGGHMRSPHGGMGYGHMGPGMGHGGHGMMGPGRRGFAALDLKVEDVKTWFTRRLAIRGNKRLKLGKVTKKDDNTILAEIVTVDGSLVERFAVDRRTGFMRSVE